MKRCFAKAAAALTAALLLLSGCSVLQESKAEKAQGQEKIEASMKRYNDQQSGGYEVYDNTTGELLESFVYSFDEIGFLAYLLETHYDGADYKEFSTGYEMYVETDGKGEKLKKSDERFGVYDRELSRNSRTTDSVFGLLDRGITDTQITENADGTSTIKYVYSPQEAGLTLEGGKISSYETEFSLNSSDEVVSVRQKAEGEYDGGEKYLSDCTIKFIEPDSVGVIENPITVEEESSDAEEQ